MEFKEAQNKVAEFHGFSSWSSIKWFELDQRFEAERRKKVSSFDILLEEAVIIYTEAITREAYERGYNDRVECNAVVPTDEELIVGKATQIYTDDLSTPVEKPKRVKKSKPTEANTPE